MNIINQDEVENIGIEELINIANHSGKQAYAPYSNFIVGVALETTSGEVFQGCNIENISFSLTCCAERVAIFSAIANGQKQFTRMVINTTDDSHVTPCGACRQVMAEFVDPDFTIILVNGSGELEKIKFGDLMPDPFQPNSKVGSNTL